MNTAKQSQQVKKLAQENGFAFCGISKAGFLEEEAPRLEAWLNQGMHGKMQYMENYFDKRLDPTKLVPGAKSVISLLMNYFPSEQAPISDAKISKYAYGTDYHHVIKNRLKQMVQRMQEEMGSFHARIFVDSAPVLDKAWAKKSGLGWIGKNANLIHPKAGSFYFIAEIICDLNLEYDQPIKDYCGNCTRCIDACPTEAIVEPYVVNGSKCISYFTIELKGAIPIEYQEKMQDWAFGCDICQDVCPWNKFSQAHQEPLFSANKSMLSLQKKDWLELTEEIFKDLLKDSPLLRTGLEGMRRNVSV